VFVYSVAMPLDGEVGAFALYKEFICVRCAMPIQRTCVLP
jgi:hypothetical protein